MNLIFGPGQANPLVVATSGLGLSGVDVAIHPSDTMYWFLSARNQDPDAALAQYFADGARIWAAMRAVLEWRFGALDRISTLLDFASGHGRVTRFIVRDVPAERVWVSDILPDGVAFQEERFGVHGIVSAEIPEEFAPGETFDAILAGSFFSHLPERVFTRWLERLGNLLRPGGILIFTVHDQSLLDGGKSLPRTGLLFEEVSESASLGTSTYGTTWVSEAFVSAAAERAVPGSSLARFPRRYCNFQDLYVLAREPYADFSGLSILVESGGMIEHASIQLPDQLVTQGWVSHQHSDGASPGEMQLALGGEVRARTSDFVPREDVALAFPRPHTTYLGWKLQGRLPREISGSSPMEVRVVSAKGEGLPLFSGTLEGLLLRSALFDCHFLHRRAATKPQEQEAVLEREIAALRDRIQAMQASRFWQLRNAWFAIKRFLKLTEEE